MAGEKYTAIGTSQGLFLYYGEDFYDISPLATAISGATFTSTNNNATVTINKASHGLAVGRYVTFSSVTLPGGGATGYATTDFTEKTYEIITTATNSFTITMSAVESGTGMTAAGAATIDPYELVGPTFKQLVMVGVHIFGVIHLGNSKNRI